MTPFPVCQKGIRQWSVYYVLLKDAALRTIERCGTKIVDMNDDNSISTLLRCCDPRLSMEEENEFLSFWTEVIEFLSRLKIFTVDNPLRVWGFTVWRREGSWVQIKPVDCLKDNFNYIEKWHAQWEGLEWISDVCNVVENFISRQRCSTMIIITYKVWHLSKIKACMLNEA